MLYLDIFGLKFQKKLLLYFKSAPSNLPNDQVLCKDNKAPQNWGQKCLIWIFLGRNYKKVLSYLKLVPQNLSKMSFKQYCEFWHKVRFFLKSRVNFSEGSSSGPFYEVRYFRFMYSNKYSFVLFYSGVQFHFRKTTICCKKCNRT